MKVAAAILLLMANSHQADILQWQERRLRSLKAEDGWLTLTGLFWLQEGRNTFEGVPGIFELRSGKVTWRHEGQSRELEPDPANATGRVMSGSLTFYAIKRGDRLGVRVKDKNSRYRREFTGLRYFPIRSDYRITAPLVAEPRRIPIPNILGQMEQMESPGYITFRLQGRDLRLYPVLEEPGAKDLFFIFRDLTSGKETYGAGRFLYADPPKDGNIILDFNKAYNPPCAFTPYATCPLPPPENRLPVRIEAGELKYGEH